MCCDVCSELYEEVKNLQIEQAYYQEELKLVEAKLATASNPREVALGTSRVAAYKGKLAFVEIQLAKKRDAQAAVGRLFVGAAAENADDHKCDRAAAAVVACASTHCCRSRLHVCVLGVCAFARLQVCVLARAHSEVGSGHSAGGRSDERCGAGEEGGQ